MPWFFWKRRSPMLLIFILLLAYLPLIKSGWAFLPSQSECQLECQNNGVCAYNTENSAQHKCICFIGLYYGDQCQYAVETPSTIVQNNNPNISESEEENNRPLNDDEIEINSKSTHQTNNEVKLEGHKMESPSEDEFSYDDEVFINEGETKNKNENFIVTEKVITTQEIPSTTEEIKTIEEITTTEEITTPEPTTTTTETTISTTIKPIIITPETNIATTSFKSTSFYAEETTSIEKELQKPNIILDNGQFEPNSNIKKYENTRTTQQRSEMGFGRARDSRRRNQKPVKSSEIQEEKLEDEEWGRRKNYRKSPKRLYTITTTTEDTLMNLEEEGGWMLTRRKHSSTSNARSIIMNFDICKISAFVSIFFAFFL